MPRAPTVGRRYVKASKKNLLPLGRQRRKAVLYRGPFQPVHYFKRNVELAKITITNGTTSTFYAYSFKLNHLHDFNYFTDMYDFFQITKVKLTFIPIQNVSIGSASSMLFNNPYTNRFYSAIDYNDKTLPTSVNELREYSTCKWTPMHKMHTRVLRPQLTMAVDEDGPAGGAYGLAQMPVKPWVSTGYNASQYFGLKVAIGHNSQIETGDYFVVEATYYIKFKNYK